jgi:hypothetical protein
MTILMWEARDADGRLDELLAHVRAQAGEAAQIYRSVGGEPRVVVIDASGSGMPDVPDHLIARPPHAWEFELVTG